MLLNGGPDFAVFAYKGGGLGIGVIVHGVPHFVNHGISTVRQGHLSESGVLRHGEGVRRVGLKIVLTLEGGHVPDGCKLVAGLEQAQLLIGHAVIVNAPNGKEYLFPGVDAFLKERNPPEGYILVTPIPGLLDDDCDSEREEE